MIAMDSTVETVRIALVIVGGILLVIAALIGLVRLSKGPTTLDRAVATDLLLGIAIAAMAMEAVVNRHTTSLPIMLVLALLGFAGPVAIARFIADPVQSNGQRSDKTDGTTSSEDAASSEEEVPGA